MKKIISFSFLFLLIFILSGCSYKIVKNNEVGGDNVFSKKTECAQLISRLQTNIQEKEDIYTSGYQIRQVFYSPRLDTCLMAYEYYFCFIGESKECRINYEIEDALTMEKIFKVEQVSDNNAYEDFSNKILELSENIK